MKVLAIIFIIAATLAACSAPPNGAPDLSGAVALEATCPNSVADSAAPSTAQIIAGAPMIGFYSYNHVYDNSTSMNQVFDRQKHFANTVYMASSDPRLADRAQEAHGDNLSYLVTATELLYDVGNWGDPSIRFETRFRSAASRRQSFLDLKTKLGTALPHFLGLYTEEVFWSASALPGASNDDVMNRFNLIAADLESIKYVFAEVFPGRVFAVADAYPVFTGFLATGVYCWQCAAHVKFYGVDWVGFEGAYPATPQQMANYNGYSVQQYLANFNNSVDPGQKAFFAVPTIDTPSDRLGNEAQLLDADATNLQYIQLINSMFAPSRRAGTLFYHWQDAPISGQSAELGIGQSTRDSQHLTNAALFDGWGSFGVTSATGIPSDPSTWLWGDENWSRIAWGAAPTSAGVAGPSGASIDSSFLHPPYATGLPSLLRAAIPMNFSARSYYRDAYFVARFALDPNSTCGDGVIVRMLCNEQGVWKDKAVLNFKQGDGRPSANFIVRLPWMSGLNPAGTCELQVDAKANPQCDHVFMSNPRYVLL